MIARISLPRRVTAALLVVLLTACHSWRTTTISPAQFIAEEEPSSVRVTLRDGTQLTLDDPTIRNDSIVSEDGEAQLVVSDVFRLELRQFSVTKTVVLGIFLVPLGLAVVLIVNCAATDCPDLLGN